MSKPSLFPILIIHRRNPNWSILRAKPTKPKTPIGIERRGYMVLPIDSYYGIYDPEGNLVSRASSIGGAYFYIDSLPRKRGYM